MKRIMFVGSVLVVGATAAACCFGGQGSFDMDGPVTVLGPGFVPDPMILRGSAGGPTDASSQNAMCRGFIPLLPSHTLQLSSPMTLRILAHSDTDTTLVVRLADGSYLCNDDTGKAFGQDGAEAGLALVMAAIPTRTEKKSDCCRHPPQHRAHQQTRRAPCDPVVDPDVVGARRRRQVGCDGDDPQSGIDQANDGGTRARFVHRDNADAGSADVEAIDCLEKALRPGILEPVHPV